MPKKPKHCPKCGEAALVRNGKSEQGWQRYLCNACGFRPTTLHTTETTVDKRALRKSRRFVITSAQNDTPLFLPFLHALENYAKEHQAELIVIPTRYRNPDAFHEGAAEGMDWPEEVKPYLLDEDAVIGPGLKVMGDAKINATASDPLSQMDAIAGQHSAIYGHAQVQLRLIATPRNELPRQLMTTGSVSLKNYSRSKAGKRAHFHHTHGAVVVEFRAGQFWFRQLLGDHTGSFYDLDSLYTAKGVRRGGHKAAALVLGDEHVKFIDKGVKRATFGKGGIVDTLKPGVLVRHDMHDHFSASHHHEADTLLRVAKATRADDSVRAEMEELRDYIAETTPAGTLSLIVESNHHDHVRQWLNRFDANRDPGNACFAWKLLGAIAERIEKGENPNPFRTYLETNLPKKARARVGFLNPNEPHEICGIDVSQHGDRGANGARGSINAYAKLNRKMVVGHSHTPGIRQGAWQVGVSAPDMEYAVGLSTWMCTHCVIYPNGKRALLTVINGKWKG